MAHAAGFLGDSMFLEICKNHRISPLELKALQGSEWLSDSVINAAQLIISTQFPHKCGFQDVLYGQGLKFKKMKKFIQILHVPSPGHWITVTNYGAPEDTVFIYDSLDEPAPESAVRQVVSMLDVSSNILTVHVKPSQRQTNGWDCGVFAVANAYTIASNRDPCTVTYDKHLLRSHLLICLAENELRQFPSSAEQVPRVQSRKQHFAVEPPPS